MPAAAANANTAADTLLAALTTHRAENVFNPWRDAAPDDLCGDPQYGAEGRCRRLHQHLSAPGPRIAAIGEGLSYQGGRISGMAFTSERLLLEGANPHQPQAQGERLSSRDKPWSEPSATVVWRTAYEADIAPRLLTWNAFPWHPLRAGDPYSNRKPSRGEERDGLDVLQLLMRTLEIERWFAVGQVAAGQLQRLGIRDVVALRHPAYGGALIFRQGLLDALAA